jgi:Kre9/KNH-like N-terminal Ig-like domain
LAGAAGSAETNILFSFPDFQQQFDRRFTALKPPALLCQSVEPRFVEIQESKIVWTAKGNMMIQRSAGIRLLYIALVLICFLGLSCKKEAPPEPACKPKLKLLEPDERSIWELDKQYKIRWKSNCPAGPVQLRLRDNEEYVETLTLSTEDTGEYLYNVPDWLPPGSIYRIRIHYVNHSDVHDNSKVFRVTDDPLNLPKIKLTFPKANEILETGRTYTLTWEAEKAVGNVRIRLRKGKKFIDTVYAKAEPGADKGSYQYTVPQFAEPGSDYRIRVNFADDKGIFDNSPLFAIAAGKVVPPKK